MEMIVKSNYYTNKIKLDLCRKHRLYLMLIYRMSRGTGMVLQEQFVKTVLMLEYDKTKKTVLKKLNEMFNFIYSLKNQKKVYY